MSATIDLHVHTSASDGLHAPSEVVMMACRAGLEAIAITDHDTMAGIAEAQASARDTGLEIIPGVEISTDADGAEVHILGLYVQDADGRLRRALEDYRRSRLDRGQQILERLDALGIPIRWEDVLAKAEGGAVGRPHVARALVDAGYVSSVPEAFSRLLAQGMPAYVPRDKVTPADALRLIHAAGGVSVLAHPWGIRYMVESLADSGLLGLETYYPGYGPDFVAALSRLADDYGLVRTGGSDFHGLAIAPDNLLGSVDVPRSCLTAVRARRRLS